MSSPQNPPSKSQQAPSSNPNPSPDPTSSPQNNNSQTVPFFKLFRYADKTDKLMMLIGSLASIANGACTPLGSIVLGGMSNKFTGYLYQQNITINESILDTVGLYALYFLGLALITFVLSYLSFAFWMISGDRQSLKLRISYFSSLLKQDIPFYDSLNPNELSSKVAHECFEIQSGIGEKVSSFLYTVSMSLSGFIVGFTTGWQLALVLCSSIPLVGISGGFFVMALQKAEKFRIESYSKAGAIAEECLNGIRTVVGLCGEEGEMKRYQRYISEYKNKVIKYIALSGLAIGSLMLFVQSSWALGFWFGSKLIEEKTTNVLSGVSYSVGDILTVFFSVLTGSSSLGQLTPCIKAFSSAKIAAFKAFQIIDRKSAISIDDKTGLKPEKVHGEFVFNNVKFSYPLKKDKSILNGISFTIHKNQKTAFFGESGCGKTTCMQLLERFYDVDEGSITLDGIDIRKLNVSWLRSQIGYVGQEPVLFATSIRENLLFAKDDASDEEMWDALRKANAEEFVRGLPKRLETFVGTNGTMLSGGQKQRLAIARAILKNPPILLLDEATSALDLKNELEIQSTLDQLSHNRTTILISHRLSTIQNSDQILVFDQGNIIQQGTHNSLLASKGKYHDLYNLQINPRDHNDYLQDTQRSQNDHFDAPAASLNTPRDPTYPQKTDRRAVDTSRIASNDPQKPVITFTSPLYTEQDSLILEVPVNDEEILSRPTRRQTKTVQKVTQKDMKKLQAQAVKRVFSYNKKERPALFLAFLAATINGMIFPLFSVYIANMLGIFANPQASDFRSESNRFSLYFFLSAIASLVCNTVQSLCLGINGEALALKLRADLFKKLLTLPMSFHDLPENAPGSLSTKLAIDCAIVNALGGTTVGISITAISTLITGLVIAFISSWQITLCVLAFLPLLIFAGKVQSQTMQGFSAKCDKAFKESGGFMAEALINIRTVASFAREDTLLKSYKNKLNAPFKQSLRRGNLSGLAFGLSQGLVFCLYSYVFYLGAVFVQNEYVNPVNMFKSVFAIMFAAMGVGQIAQHLPDVAQAKTAAVSLFKVLDTKNDVVVMKENNRENGPIQGYIEFKNVSFKYPTRPTQVLKNLNLTISPGSKIALVGPSGCGKSTILSLLLRFYDPQEGQILLDGRDIRTYDLQTLRKTFGVVSQEPTLFSGTIEYNIKYTNPDADDVEMKKAAEQANCLKFIESNAFEALNSEDNNEEAQNSKYGEGFQRKVGPKGNQISGGQKQRIAIARAILSKPSILLLDEATSALDSENEKIVQASLDKIMENKTCIVVAHRISTIKDADEILVFGEGGIVERGSYEELNRKQGIFYRLERGLDLVENEKPKEEIVKTC